MKAHRRTQKVPSFVITSVYSLLLHILLLFLLFSIPIYSGGASYGLSGVYSVYLINEDPAVRAGRPQRAAVPRAENASEAVGESTAPVEEPAHSSLSPFNKEEAPIIEPEGRGPEVVEAPVMQELLPAAPPEGTGQSPVSEGNVVKQETAEKEKMVQPVSQNKAEKVEKAELSENILPADRNLPEEISASESGQINKPEKKPDIAAEKPRTVRDDKTVMTATLQRDRGNALPSEAMPVPAMKQKETGKEVKIQAMSSPVGLGLNERGDLHQKVESKTAQAMPVASETRKEVTAPSSVKETVPQKLPDVRVSPGSTLSVSEEKPLQDISLTQGGSPEMTLPAAEEKAASQVLGMVPSISSPVLQAKKAEKNNDPKADLVMPKQVAESAGKIAPPKSLTIPGESTVKKEIKAGDAEGRLRDKEHSFIKGNENPPATDGDRAVYGTQTFLPAISSGRENPSDHKKNAGGDKIVANAPKQTIQKIDEAGETRRDQLKRVSDAPLKSVEMGSQKPHRIPEASGGENSSLMRLAGSETVKDGATLHLESKSGQLETALGGPPEELPVKGAENKQFIQPAAFEGLVNAGGAGAKVSSDTRNRPGSVREKTGGAEPTVFAYREKEEEKSGIGIPVSEAFIQKDIRIEVFMEGPDMSAVLTQLFKKSHPELRRKRNREKQEPVVGIVDKTISKGYGDTGKKRLVAVAKAEKAVYTFVLENKSERTRTVDVIFRFYEGHEKERGKEYKSRELLPGGLLRFSFIMPEAIFWDDEDRFSGVAEDSRTITKFDYESGLVWQEDKD